MTLKFFEVNNMVIHIDRPFFFDTVRDALFKGALNQPQVEGMTAILDLWESRMAASYCIFRF